MGQFQPNLAQSILRWRKFKSIHMEGQDLFQGERIMKYQKLIDEIKRSSLGSLGKFWPNFVKGIQVITNKDHSILEKEKMCFFYLYQINHCFLQMLFMIWSVSQVSDVTHGPLVFYSLSCLFWCKMVSILVN